MSTAAWLEQIRASVAGEPDDTTGWRTCAELAEEWGLSRPRAAELLAKGQRAGKVERRMLRIRTARGLYPTPHYRPAQ